MIDILIKPRIVHSTSPYHLVNWKETCGGIPPAVQARTFPKLTMFLKDKNPLGLYPRNILTEDIYD